MFYHVDTPFAKLRANTRMSQPASTGPSEPPAHNALGDAGSPSPLRRQFAPSGQAHPLQFVPIYFVAGIIIFFVLWAVAGFLLPPEAPKLWGQLLGEVVFAVAAIAPAFIIARAEGRPFGEYGLPVRLAFGKLFWTGAAWGFGALTILVLVLRLAGALTISGRVLHGLRIGKFALFWALFFLIVAAYEEFAFRGYTLFAISRSAGFWPIAVVSSLIFGSIHHLNAGESWTGALGAAAIGLFFCLTLRRTGTLWFAVGMHAAWNWGETFLYSVPDSGFVSPGHLLKSTLQGPQWLTGGSVGPEGSVLLFALVAVLWVAFDRMYPEVRYNVAPSLPPEPSNAPSS